MAKRCKKCKGSGYVTNVVEKVFAGVISLGAFPIIDAILSGSKAKSDFSYTCTECNGDGIARFED